MTRGVISVGPSDTVATARVFLQKHPIHHLPVVENGKVVGILTYKHLNFCDETLSVSKVMARDFVVVDPLTSVRKAASLMIAGTTGCLPVMEGTQLAGIITTSDLRRAVASPDDTLR
jgi:CBS domain-containing protein